MGMVVRTNVMAVNANRQLGMNNSQVGKSLEKLASGFRINRAGDDASGLAISEKMKAQIKGLETASANSQDGISLIQTAEGALTEVHDMLNRMVELAGKSANGTIDDNVDRAALQKEVESLQSEINRIAKGTNFNGKFLLDGSLDANAGTASGTYGSTAMTFSVESALVSASGSVIVEGAGAADTGVEAAFGGTGLAELTITLEASKTFSASDITKAVQDAAQALIDGGTVTDEGELANLRAYTNFRANFGGTVTTPADDSADMAAAASYAQAGDGVALELQVGDTADSFNKVSVSLKSMTTVGLQIDNLSVGTQEAATAALAKLKNGSDASNGYGAINVVSTVRADLGALQNRLEHTINNLDVAAENMTAANSRIRDTDMAKQMMDYTKMNVLSQAAQAMLAQANSSTQSVLQLLQ